MHQSWKIIITYLSVLVASQGVLMGESYLLHQLCPHLNVVGINDVGQRIHPPSRDPSPNSQPRSPPPPNPPSRPPAQYLLGDCVAQSGSVYRLPTQLNLDLCLGWDGTTRSLVARSNGNGIMIGGCSACVYEYIRRLGRWDLSCWCTNVPDTSKVPVPNGNFMAAPVKFDLGKYRQN